jgi:hypothetical protein
VRCLLKTYIEFYESNVQKCPNYRSRNTANENPTTCPSDKDSGTRRLKHSDYADAQVQIAEKRFQLPVLLQILQRHARLRDSGEKQEVQRQQQQVPHIEGATACNDGECYRGGTDDGVGEIFKSVTYLVHGKRNTVEWVVSGVDTGTGFQRNSFAFGSKLMPDPRGDFAFAVANLHRLAKGQTFYWSLLWESHVERSDKREIVRRLLICVSEYLTRNAASVRLRITWGQLPSNSVELCSVSQ